MAEYAKDTPGQAALRKQIETHPIWQYPPEERLTHTREWQQIYMLVFQYKKFLKEIETRLSDTSGSALLTDEAELEQARYTRRSSLRGRLDTLTFTECMRRAVARYDASSGKEFLAYFDAIYANAMHESANRQENIPQGDIGLTRREGKLWKQLCELCEKQGIDVSTMPESFYEQAAAFLQVDAGALKRLIHSAAAARGTISLNQSMDGEDESSAGMDVADPNQESIEERLERLEQKTKALRVLTLFASKDRKEFPRLFFTGDVLKPLCAGRQELPPERYCTLLEKQEDLLWNRIFVLSYLNYLFEPSHPERLRTLLGLTPSHPLQDSSVAAYTGKTPAAISYQRKVYETILKSLQNELEKE